MVKQYMTRCMHMGALACTLVRCSQTGAVQSSAQITVHVSCCLHVLMIVGAISVRQDAKMGGFALCSLASPATHGLGAVRVYPSTGDLSATPVSTSGYFLGEDLPNGVGLHEDAEEMGSSAGQLDDERPTFPKPGDDV